MNLRNTHWYVDQSGTSNSPFSLEQCLQEQDYFIQIIPGMSSRQMVLQTSHGQTPDHLDKHM